MILGRRQPRRSVDAGIDALSRESFLVSLKAVLTDIDSMLALPLAADNSGKHARVVDRAHANIALGQRKSAMHDLRAAFTIAAGLAAR